VTINHQEINNIKDILMLNKASFRKRTISQVSDSYNVQGKYKLSSAIN
jgi:hypothetical protein